MIGLSEISKFVYSEHIHNYGKPDESIRFGDPNSYSDKKNVPNYIDILVWYPNGETEITTFSTIGMCNSSMHTAEYRAELHFAVREMLDEYSVHQIANFLANLAVYPFINNTYFDWWHMHIQPNKIPLFKFASMILFHPAFVNKGWNDFYFHNTQIKVLNVVPITPDEYKVLKNQENSYFLEYSYNNEVDIFLPR